MTKVSKMKNPFFMGDQQDIGLMNKDIEFHSEVFVLREDGTGDNAAYEELMNEIFPFSDSNKILNPYSTPTRSTNAEGNIIIHLEYLILNEEEDPIRKKAEKKAKEEGREDDEAYIKKMYKKYSGGIDQLEW